MFNPGDFIRWINHGGDFDAYPAIRVRRGRLDLMFVNRFGAIFYRNSNHYALATEEEIAAAVAELIAGREEDS